jgi:hypothetical protein
MMGCKQSKSLMQHRDCHFATLGHDNPQAFKYLAVHLMFAEVLRVSIGFIPRFQQIGRLRQSGNS